MNELFIKHSKQLVSLYSFCFVYPVVLASEDRNDSQKFLADVQNIILTPGKGSELLNGVALAFVLFFQYIIVF